MADTLYLSLWYPNLRLEGLGDKLVQVLAAFAAHGGEPGVYSATVWPVSWSESPVFQQLWGRMAGEPAQGGGSTANSVPGIEPRLAVEEALELLHDDYAYEFQIGWSLWELEETGEATADPSTRPLRSLAQDDTPKGARGAVQDESARAMLDPRWLRSPRLVRVTGFGPLFEEGAYEQDGHIRIDFGSDTAFLEEDVQLDAIGARHVEENVRQLVSLTQAVEKESGATARLLWSELGESLASRLAARLGMRN